MGDVDYGKRPERKEAAESALALRSDDPRAELMRSGALPNYRPLTNTRGEIDGLKASFAKRFPQGSVQVLAGGEASETAFRTEAPRTAFVHLATHGFFAPARLKSALAQQPSQTNLRSDAVVRQGVAGFHPGLLSGVVFAGANGADPGDEDDGVLTALEASALDLEGVQLAVLSACETGLGEAAGGEGVLGLQRAFQLAGVKTVVSSLWKVPDRATSQLIQRFYANLWGRGLSGAEALREAQIWMLRGGDDQAERASVPPEDWAAFTLSGDWW
ncbi:MAG: CHAT domain-containing protein [Planctomycetota bacterium]